MKGGENLLGSLPNTRRMKMRILSKEIYRKIEYYLYNYFGIKKEIAEYRENTITAKAYNIGEHGGGRSYHSDPTAMKAVRLSEVLEKEKWTKVIEGTVSYFGDSEKGKLLELKYFDKCRKVHICQKLHIEHATYYRWQNDIVLYAAMLAIQDDLIEINKTA